MPAYLRKLVKGDLWFYKFDYRGKTYFSKAIYKTKQEAKRAEAERLSSIKNVVEEVVSVDTLTAINDRLKYLHITASVKYYNENKCWV